MKGFWILHTGERVSEKEVLAALIANGYSPEYARDYLTAIKKEGGIVAPGTDFFVFITRA